MDCDLIDGMQLRLDLPSPWTCLHRELGNPSLETKVLLDSEYGVTAGDRVMLWTPHCDVSCPLLQVCVPHPGVELLPLEGRLPRALVVDSIPWLREHTCAVR